jgi:hypothetical protein
MDNLPGVAKGLLADVTNEAAFAVVCHQVVVVVLTLLEPLFGWTVQADPGLKTVDPLHVLDEPGGGGEDIGANQIRVVLLNIACKFGLSDAR